MSARTQPPASLPSAGPSPRRRVDASRATGRRVVQLPSIAPPHSTSIDTDEYFAAVLQ
jgi:hypothetical protein